MVIRCENMERHRVVGQWLGRLLWEQDIVEVQVLPTLHLNLKVVFMVKWLSRLTVNQLFLVRVQIETHKYLRRRIGISATFRPWFLSELWVRVPPRVRIIIGGIAQRQLRGTVNALLRVQRFESFYPHKINVMVVDFTSSLDIYNKEIYYETKRSDYK